VCLSLSRVNFVLCLVNLLPTVDIRSILLFNNILRSNVLIKCLCIRETVRSFHADELYALSDYAAAFALFERT
jgi:hypothetical protein